MTLIESARARQILDSRGNGTVEVDLRSGAYLGRAASASGASTGAHEAQSFPHGGLEESLRIFHEEVARRLNGRDARDQAGLDQELHDLDGTPNFSRMGGNLATAVSLASARLAAAAAQLPLFRYLGGPGAATLPVPFGNVIGGGRHARGGTTFQEFLVVSQGPRAERNVMANVRVHRRVGEALALRFPERPLGRGDEGAWVAALDDEDALRLLAGICEEVEREVGFPVRPALDPAASEFYRDGRYRFRDRSLSPSEQVTLIERLVRDYGVVMVEDPLQEEDFENFATLTRSLGSRCKVVGDDIFVTNVTRIRQGIECGAANAVLIKPNQIGTLTDTRAAVDLAHRAGYATIVSHRSGETTDDTIAHLAVAFGSYGLKSGAVGGERLAKLNELIRIEESLGRR